KQLLPQKTKQSLQHLEEVRVLQAANDQFIAELNAVSENGKYGPDGCFHVMRTGNYCPFGSKCNRSHKAAVLGETRKYWIDAIGKIKYSDSTVICSEKPRSCIARCELTVI